GHGYLSLGLGGSGRTHHGGAGAKCQADGCFGKRTLECVTSLDECWRAVYAHCARKESCGSERRFGRRRLDSLRAIQHDLRAERSDGRCGGNFHSQLSPDAILYCAKENCGRV